MVVADPIVSGREPPHPLFNVLYHATF